ncbi:MAG: hypothetical protein KDN22_16295 [Verrucomicrobiae bacterium]|nr:hypothetical protein [Verrucomicrobiae bacterium]
MKSIFLRILFAFLAVSIAAAEPPGILNYQGRINVDGSPFNGAGAFKFALVDAGGTTTYWSNDGTSTAGDEPTDAVSLTVNGGRYSVGLGDTTLANMSAAIPAAVFADNTEVFLRIWFDDGVNGSQLLSPDQRLGSVGYALTAGSVDAANVTGTLGSGQLPAEVVLDGASNVTLSGAFTGDGSGLTSLDSASLTGPLALSPFSLDGLLGQIDDGGYALDVAVAGSYAYLANREDGLRVYDVTDPANPFNVAHVAIGTGEGDAYGIAVSGSHAYLASYDDGLRVVDISVPGAPRVISQIDTGGLARDVAVSGNYAYVANDADGLRIYDITDPFNPASAAHLDDGGQTRDVVVSGNHAYVANDGDGVRIYNITTPTAPQSVGHISNSVTVLSVAVAGNYAYVAYANDGLAIYDVSNPASPVQAGGVAGIGAVLNVAVTERTAYVASIENGLSAYDIRDPANPVLLNQVNDSGNPFGVTISGHHAYLANGLGGLWIYALSSSVSAGGFTGDGSGLTGIDLGAQAAKQSLSLGGNDIAGAGTVTATAFVGNGSGLTNVPGDDLGDHTATEALKLDGHYLSGDGDPEGVFVDSAGKVGIGIDAPVAKLEVGGDLRLNAEDPEIVFYDASNAARKSSIETVFEGGTSIPPKTAADQKMHFKVSNNSGQNMTRVMTLRGDGRVGIGTSDPLAKLDIAATGNGENVLMLSTERAWVFQQEGTGDFASLRLRNYAGGDRHLSIDTDGQTKFRTQNGSAVTMTVDHDAGNVGIGTTTPVNGKLQIAGHSGSVDLPYGYLNSAGNTGTASGQSAYSIYATNRVAAQEFRAHSDERIKNIRGTSDAGEDLHTLMGIKVTDYTLRDTVAMGDAPQKKVIAQQVAKAYPQAVTTNLTEVVPDIYRRAELADGWVTLATDLKPGEKVKLIGEAHSGVFEVLAVREGAFQVDWEHRGEVFVYGREVDDFHTVDYEAIAMLNVSATQEQQRLIERQQTEIASLKGELESLKELVSALATGSKKDEAKPVVSR